MHSGRHGRPGRSTNVAGIFDVVENQEDGRIGPADGGLEINRCNGSSGRDDPLGSSGASPAPNVGNNANLGTDAIRVVDERPVLVALDNLVLDEELGDPPGSHPSGDGVEPFEPIPDASGRHQKCLRR